MDRNDPCGPWKVPITLQVGAQGWGVAQRGAAQGSSVRPRTGWEWLMLCACIPGIAAV